MKDQPSTSGDRKEPPRPKTIPDDFIWDPEVEAWYPPGEPSPFTAEYWLHFLDDLTEEDYGGPGPRLISRDELLAAGALNVSSGKRKTLGVERDHLPLFPDDDQGEEQQPPRPGEGDCDESADDV
ncbi:MAG: hypothetical protein WD894_10500 [Pirellulales bacterium]